MPEEKFMLPIRVWEKLTADQRTDFTQQVHMLIVDAIIHCRKLEGEENDAYKVSNMQHPFFTNGQHNLISR
jgi:hypothetical protein